MYIYIYGGSRNAPYPTQGCLKASATFCRGEGINLLPGGGDYPSAGTFCHFTVGEQAIKTEEAAGSL